MANKFILNPQEITRHSKYSQCNVLYAQRENTLLQDFAKIFTMELREVRVAYNATVCAPQQMAFKRKQLIA